MTDLISIINFTAVGLFGTFLSASFCDILWTKEHRRVFGAGVVLLTLTQAATFLSFGELSLTNAYPLLTHLPLTLLLWYLCRKKVWSLIAVLTAYLCCQLRRWIPLLLVSILNGDGMMQDVAEIVITPALLWAIIRFASPAVRRLSSYPLHMQIQFGMVPFVGYIFDYLTRIYTDWLVMGAPAATEFMLFVCAVAQLIFARHSSDVLQRQREHEQLRTVLELQVKQSVRQISEMKKSQELAAQYRHDLRHHLQYLSGCLDGGELDQAQAYITSLNDEVTRQSVTIFCKNISANLILSSFARRAAEAGVPMSINVQLDEQIEVTDGDLCVVLSNALENALHACVAQKLAQKEAVIRVQGHMKNGRVFLEIINSCADNIRFEKDLPVAQREGHGIGVRSICAIVEKYGGLYVFLTEGGHFILRVSI